MGNSKISDFHFMRLWTGMFLMLMTSVLYAQKVTPADSTEISKQDSLEQIEEPIRQFSGGIFLEALVESVPGLRKRNFSQQFGLGIKYERWSIGIYQNLALGKTTKTLIFPNEFRLIYGYGGAFAGLEFLQSRWVLATFRANYGIGDMIWEREDNGEDFLRDTYQLIKPEVQITYTPIPYFRFFGTIGYRHFIDLELSSIDQRNFSGVTFAVGIKAGYFR